MSDAKNKSHDIILATGCCVTWQACDDLVDAWLHGRGLGKALKRGDKASGVEGSPFPLGSPRGAGGTCRKMPVGRPR